MKIFRGIKEKYDELILGEDGEFTIIYERSYAVHVESCDEYESLQHFIKVAIEKDIEVYDTSCSFRKLEICDSKVIGSSFPVYLFLTNDKDKYDSLDLVIKNIMMANNKIIDNNAIM